MYLVYASGWEPVLYVNNIRRYYKIIKWLTDSEPAPEDESPVAVDKIEIASSE